MHKLIFTFFLMVLINFKLYSQFQEKKETHPEAMHYAQPEIIVSPANQTTKSIGKNIIDVTLNAPLHFIPRNQEITILSSQISEAGNYLIILKMTGEDTNTFYPQRYVSAPLDSDGYVYIDLKGNDKKETVPFLLKQNYYFADSINNTVKFLSIPAESSIVKFLNQNDTIKLKVNVEAILSEDLKESNAPPKWINSWSVNTAELILIKQL